MNNSFIDTLKKLGPGRLAALGGVFAGLLVFFIFVSSQVSKPSLTLLYGDLSTVNSASVAAKLQEIGIPFEVSADGAQIRVPGNDLGRARMLLAEAGLPNGGTMGYEIFDQKSGFGTTSFVQNINQVRALQGELARTISTLDAVDFAKVHLVLPQRELFSRETTGASASVTLRLRPNARLTREQIFGIQNLVANAVPELKPQNVTIIDTDANLLAGGNRDADTSTMAGLKAEEMRQAYERRLTLAIEDMVGRVVGFNKVRANVSADLNFDRSTTNSEIYDPEGQVARSTQTIEEGSNDVDAVGGEVTVQNNLPGGAGDNMLGGARSSSNRLEEVTNFEISRTVQNVVRESGEVKRLSVAVLVDGRTVTNPEGERVYEPRSEAELSQIETLVRSAIGFEAARGDTVEVINMPFTDIDLPELDEDTTLFGFDRSQLLQTAEMVMLAIMGILVILLVLKPIMTSLFQAQKAAQDEARKAELLLSQSAPTPALSGPSSMPPATPEEQMDDEGESLIDMNAVEGKVKASTVRKVGDIVSNHPNETVSILRNWMTQE